MNRREFLKKGLEGIVIGIPLISGCEINPVDYSSLKNQVNLEFGRIIPFISIDGVNLGDKMETVEKKLGKSDGGFRWDGLYGGGIGYIYNEGFHAGLEVIFMGSDYVECLWVKSPYSGTTKENIGIGSSLESLHEVYGMPDEIFLNIRDEVYYSNNREFRITYNENSYIKSIDISFTH